MGMVGLKEVVYGIIALVFIAFGAFLIFKYVPQANVVANSTVGGFVDKFFPFGENKNTRDTFKQYFKEEFLESYVECRNSKNKGCWCIKKEFEIPDKFSVDISYKDGLTKFNLLDKEGYEFTETPYFVQEVKPCIIVDGKKISSYVENGIRIKRNSDSYVYFKDSNGKEHKKEVDLSLLFYKHSGTEICVVEKSSIGKLNKSRC
jgi:hypothetical protein